MLSPLRDGGTTKTMDIPTDESAARPTKPRGRASLPWVAIIAAVVVLLGMLVLAVVVLIS
jgi:hypothetical protein